MGKKTKGASVDKEVLLEVRENVCLKHARVLRLRCDSCHLIAAYGVVVDCTLSLR